MSKIFICVVRRLTLLQRAPLKFINVTEAELMAGRYIFTPSPFLLVHFFCASHLLFVYELARPSVCLSVCQSFRVCREIQLRISRQSFLAAKWIMNGCNLLQRRFSLI